MRSLTLFNRRSIDHSASRPASPASTRVGNTLRRSGVPALAASVSTARPKASTTAAATSGRTRASPRGSCVNGQHTSAPSQSPVGPVSIGGTSRARLRHALAASSPNACTPRGNPGTSARCSRSNALRPSMPSQRSNAVTSQNGEPYARHL